MRFAPQKHSEEQDKLIPSQPLSNTKASHQGVTAPGYTAAEQNIDKTTEDISNKAQGHKANLNNPSKTQSHASASARTTLTICDSIDTSEESKEKSRQALKELGGEEAFYGKQGKGE